MAATIGGAMTGAPVGTLGVAGVVGLAGDATGVGLASVGAGPAGTGIVDRARGRPGPGSCRVPAPRP